MVGAVYNPPTMQMHSFAAAPWATDLRIALSFLTRLPVTAPGSLPANGLARAMRAFPLAGAAVGAISGAVLLAALPPLTPAIAAVLAVLAAVWVTGGLHEDGLADTADGFGGAGDRTRRLAIMRDSRIGSFGVVALVLSLGLRASALAALAADPAAAVLALIAAGALSRAVMPVAMRLAPPARSDGLGFGAGKPPAGTAATAMLLAAATALACLPFAGAVAAVLAAMATTFGLCRLAERKIGGFTGDVLGALQQGVEIAVLLVAVAAS